MHWLPMGTRVIPGDLDFNLIIEGDNFDSLRLLRATPLQCPRRRTPIVKRL